MSCNNHRKNGKLSSRFHANNGHVTEDERLLRRPAQLLLSPTEPMPLEQIKEEEHAIERGIHSVFTVTDPWRVFRIMSEFVEGFDSLAHIPPSVAIFGSARVKPEDPVYAAAVETARLLAKAGFGIITGGGQGIMEAANRGAQEGGNFSIGCNIELPFEQRPNSFLDISYWGSLITWIREMMLATQKILPEDAELFVLSDDSEEICNIVIEAYQESYHQEHVHPLDYREQSIR